MSKANVVDSPGWQEYLADSKSAGFLAPAIEDAAYLILPGITVYAVAKKCCGRAGKMRRSQWSA